MEREHGAGGRPGLGLEFLYRVDSVLLATEEKGRGNGLIPTVPLLTPINGKSGLVPFFDTGSLTVPAMLL